MQKYLQSHFCQILSEAAQFRTPVLLRSYCAVSQVCAIDLRANTFFEPRQVFLQLCAAQTRSLTERWLTSHRPVAAIA